MRLRRRRIAVSSYDLRALRWARRRALARRIGLAGGAVGLLAAAAASARDLDVRERSFLPPGSTGVVVVDVSLSIAEANYVDVRRTLKQLIRIDARTGMRVGSGSEGGRLSLEAFQPGSAPPDSYSVIGYGDPDAANTGPASASPDADRAARRGSGLY